jgi:hypothetical protein
MPRPVSDGSQIRQRAQRAVTGDLEAPELSDSLQVHRLAKRLQRLQNNRYLVYGIAVAGVALASSALGHRGYVLTRLSCLRR